MRKTVKIPKKHKIRVNRTAFNDIAKGYQSFAIIENNLNLDIGEQIIFVEYNGRNHSGRDITAEVTYLTNKHVQKGYVAFGFRKWSIQSERQQRPGS